MNLIIILQSLNIIVFTALAMMMPWQGFIAWWFGGSFMLLVQAPAFILLLVLQLMKLRTLKRNNSTVNWKMQCAPMIVLVVCMMVSYLAGVFHLDDPFFHDAYEIEVIFNPDKTCSVKMNGTVIPEHMTYSYEWKHEHHINCRSDNASVLIHLAQPSGQLVKPGIYALTSEEDSQNYALENSGAYFDNTLGVEYSPSIAGTVYWDFISGTFTISSVANTDTESTPFLERTPILTGIIKAIGKRHHSGS